jgi:hypothetical protein
MLPSLHIGILKMRREKFIDIKRHGNLNYFVKPFVHGN